MSVAESFVQGKRVRARPTKIISCGRHGMIYKSRFYISLCLCLCRPKVCEGGGLQKKGPTQTQTHKHWVMCLVMGARLCVCVCVCVCVFV
jgi:hypothetical protein